MKKILAPLMILSLVAILTPAYASTNEIEIDFNPTDLTTKISWDFGNNPDRENCVSYSKSYLDPYRNGVRYETPTKTWEGTNYQDATSQSNLNGPSQSIYNLNGPSPSNIDCKGKLVFSLWDVHNRAKVNYYYSTELVMSFGEALMDGTITPLNEVDILLDNKRTHKHVDDCATDQFEKTTYIEVYPKKATQYDLVEGADHGNDCTVTTTDLTDRPQYMMYYGLSGFHLP